MGLLVAMVAMVVVGVLFCVSPWLLLWVVVGIVVLVLLGGVVGAVGAALGGSDSPPDCIHCRDEYT